MLDAETLGQVRFWTGYDEALIGISIDLGVPRPVYCAERLRRLVRQQEGVSDEEAENLIEYNLTCQYDGPWSPIISEPLGARASGDGDWTGADTCGGAA